MTIQRVKERFSEAELSEPDEYTGPAFDDGELVDLPSIDTGLHASLDKHNLLAAGMDPKVVESLYPGIRALSRDECDTLWAETYDNLSPQQELLIELDSPINHWRSGDDIARAVPAVQEMTTQERADFFGGMQKANLIALAYRLRNGKFIRYI